MIVYMSTFCLSKESKKDKIHFTTLRAKRAKNKEEFSVFCLQNGTSFGKSQLLNDPTLANQNKNKMAGKQPKKIK